MVTFADENEVGGGRIRSDGGGDGGVYVDGPAAFKAGSHCRRATSFSGPSIASRPVTSLGRIVIDLSDRVWPSCSDLLRCPTYANELDVCGPNEIADVAWLPIGCSRRTQPASPCRSASSRTSVSTGFRVGLRGDTGVSGSGTTRTMTTAGTNAIGELWQISGRTKTLLGRYRMPLRATVSPRP